MQVKELRVADHVCLSETWRLSCPLLRFERDRCGTVAFYPQRPRPRRSWPPGKRCGVAANLGGLRARKTEICPSPGQFPRPGEPLVKAVAGDQFSEIGRQSEVDPGMKECKKSKVDEKIIYLCLIN